MTKNSDSSSFHRHMGVYGICCANNRILVIRKILGPYTGRYDLPGGRLEKLETLEQGIIRELREETGYTVRTLQNIGVCDFTVTWTMKDDTIENLHHIAILYEAAVDTDELTSTIDAFEGQDSNGAAWLALEEVTAANSSPS
ncbi:NUDIX hydrolase [Paenibacillus albus]|uniref:NUDIX hydrolase n=1 Tax=Paenibacillus albus TaxID=2495582 RepID=UPI001D130CC6|nr:NUDIX hydrolase [Paenibacillus albus]